MAAKKTAKVKKTSSPSKKAPVPNLDHTVNMGPERGDNTFPPRYKKAGDTAHPV